MVEFGGWDMPIQYTSVLDEHRACRTGAAVFDVSHLGSVRVSGPGALAALQWAFTNDLGRVRPGRAQYTHLLDPVDAHVVDDIIVWWIADGDFVVMPNASNTDRIVGALGEAVADHADGDVAVLDVTSGRAILAVQGPHARDRLAAVHAGAAAVPRFGVEPADFHGAPGFAAGTGYTGEDGVELHVPVEVAAMVFDDLVEAGITPAGLGARDTLRLEAGLPLHGHELGPGITSLQAGLGWVVRFLKPDFRGRTALVAERDRGIARRLVGLATAGRQVPRAECPVLRDGAVVGMVTSGNFSPMLSMGIALGFIDADAGVSLGDPATIAVRGRTIEADIVPFPFWPPRS